MQKAIHTEADMRKSEVKKWSRTPWIIGIFILLAAFLQYLLSCFGRAARKNMPFALGTVMFLGLFALMSYNASFRQKSVVRPVLFSTRAAGSFDKYAWQWGGQQKIPFVDITLSTKALGHDNGAVGDEQVFDDVADLIAASMPAKALRKAIAVPETKPRNAHGAREARGRQNAEERPQRPARAQKSLPLTQIQAVPRYNSDRDIADKGYSAGKQKNWAGPSREQIVRVQKALARAGQPNLPVTGVWDIKTRAAVRRFQKAQGLPETSKIDKNVIQKLHDLGLW